MADIMKSLSAGPRRSKAFTEERFAQGKSAGVGFVSPGSTTNGEQRDYFRLLGNGELALHGRGVEAFHGRSVESIGFGHQHERRKSDHDVSIDPQTGGKRAKKF